jgi:hypothetical protein
MQISEDSFSLEQLIKYSYPMEMLISRQLFCRAVYQQTAFLQSSYSADSFPQEQLISRQLSSISIYQKNALL